MQTFNVSRPTALINGQGLYVPQTFQNLSFRGDLNGGSNLVYIGYAKPGSSESAPVWQIFFIQYSSGPPTSITWPVGSDGVASNDFAFEWSNRASYTYV